MWLSLKISYPANEDKTESYISFPNLQNDEYNTKMVEKEKEKVETEQKLNTVREMAHALRDQMVQLEGQIDQGMSIYLCTLQAQDAIIYLYSGVQL